MEDGSFSTLGRPLSFPKNLMRGKGTSRPGWMFEIQYTRNEHSVKENRPVMPEYNQDVQETESDRGNGEEVTGGDVGNMMVQEGTAGDVSFPNGHRMPDSGFPSFEKSVMLARSPNPSK